MSTDKEKVFSFLFRKQLPTLPTIFTEFTKLMENPYVSNAKIADLIKKDQAMMVKILKLSNSAMYGKRQEIRNLTNAITYLGLETLKNIILQIALVRMFDFKDNKIPDFNPASFWEHSIATAYFAGLLEKKLKLPHDENFYIGGLLHDIGKVLIYQFYPTKFEDMVLIQIEDEIPDYEAEKEVLGVDHAELGGVLAEKWKFDKAIINAIQYHHSMLKSRSSTLTAIVSIANLFSKKTGLCFPWDDRSINIKGFVGWEMLSEQSKMNIDIDHVILQLTEEADNVKETVETLLKTL
ncbi:MAG: HDOD domain-containing protein [bacterium]|nr:HDOD domain-containing protein [bacterium]